MPNRPLSASLEDYLETICVLVDERGAARAKDIAEHMDVHKSTVTAALHALSKRGLVEYTPYRPVQPTAKGRQMGAAVLRRHETLCRFLTTVLRIDKETAEDTACKMEHVIPSDVIDRFTAFAQYIDYCPRAGADWRRGFGYFCTHGPEEGRCERCMEQSLHALRERMHCNVPAGDGEAAS